MSTLVLMKILESTPSRYDRGIKILLGRKLFRAYDKILEKVNKGDNVLDIGCGTGILSLMMAQKGGYVKGIDINAGMIEIAQQRIKDENLEANVAFEEKGVAELDTEIDEHYDIITSTLCFSELEGYEIEYTLKQIHRMLKPNGIFILVDEMVPTNIFKRILSLLIRIPLVIITYIVTQSTTKAMKLNKPILKANNFEIKDINKNWLGSFQEIVCVKV